MPLRDWFRPPRSLLTLYVIGAVTALACLIWLGARLLEQEQVVEAERARIQLEAAADIAVASTQRSLDDLGRALAADAGEPPPNTVVITATRDGLFRASPAGRLPFVPVVPPSPEPPTGTFVDGEQAENQGTTPEPAIAIYRALSTRSSPEIRAGALMRLGRTLRNAGRRNEALRAYATLATLDGVSVEGRPADLLAREARGSILEDTNQRADLEREAAELRRDLVRGRWPLTEARWQFLFDEASDWAGPAAPAIDGLDDAVALARATDTFWRQWRDAPPPAAPTVTIRQDDATALVRWQATPSGVHAAVAGPAYLDALWRRVRDESGADIALSDLGGQDILGRAAGAPVVRSANATGLPWTIAVHAFSSDPAADRVGTSGRLLVAALAIIVVLVAGSSYFTFRGIRRELATARLQSEFVSAVSHEFRTPLTSIRQLSHMLRQGRIPDEDRRGQYYDVLVRESERLHRLVERLLSFGRADADRYRFEPIDARDLARAVAAEFEPHANGRPVDLDVPDLPCPIRADREMLSLAIWNLLDNAVKYSPDGGAIHVAVAAAGAEVTMAVRDEGAGIAPDDRRRIFEKFVRGGASQTNGVPGSGLGLALVKRVAEAHHGQVRLTSEPGRGSTFTITIPQEAA